MLAIIISALIGFVAGVILNDAYTYRRLYLGREKQLIHQLDCENRSLRRQVLGVRTIRPEPPMQYSPERKWWEKNRFNRPR